MTHINEEEKKLIIEGYNDQAKFWRQAQKLIRKSYGKSCKDFEWGCVTCQAGLVSAWIEGQIDLIRWKEKDI